MVAGDLEVGDDQVVLQGTADAHDAAERELVERGRAAVPVDRWRPRRAAWSLLLGEVWRGLLRLRHGLLVRRLLLLPASLLGLVLRSLLRRCLLLERVLRGRRLLGPARVRALRGVRLLLRLGLRRAGRGLCAGQAHARSVGRVAQVQHRAGAELQLLDPLSVHEGAVGAAVVLDHPTAAVETDRGMPPGDPGVVENKLPLRIAS
ncbi:hypothetical protein GCM10010330_69780 [Streptomyces tendae]|nr:hypothetical protein GCM10010330_69780 [Streptomyces tendae]